MSLSSGAYFGSHSVVSQWARSASATSVALLTWIGPQTPPEAHRHQQSVRNGQSATMLPRTCRLLATSNVGGAPPRARAHKRIGQGKCRFATFTTKGAHIFAQETRSPSYLPGRDWKLGAFKRPAKLRRAAFGQDRRSATRPRWRLQSSSNLVDSFSSQ
jgi:hypothetical protein